MSVTAYYHNDISKFNATSDDEIVGALTRNSTFSTSIEQAGAWRGQLPILREALRTFETGAIFLELTIPRIGKRADAVLIIGGLISVIEFKVGANKFNTAAICQAHDYALDLKNFHAGSHTRAIAPIVVATQAESTGQTVLQWASDRVLTPICVVPSGLGEMIARLLRSNNDHAINVEDWMRSRYQPTPTIIEAAEALYRGHNVSEISRSDAGAQNLGATTDRINAIITHSKQQNQKSICFVTGVPGAGKTLAGLNTAVLRKKTNPEEHAVFLSGNGPLVDVLREALARDQAEREGIPKTKAFRAVGAFVQNVHHFRDNYVNDKSAPIDKVVIFDEAQRAWTEAQASKFMTNKRRVENFNMSEPEFLISVMDRHSDWCVVVCLVGGGQEINTGEAGMMEWISAFKNKYQHWGVYASELLMEQDDIDANTRNALRELRPKLNSELHLSVSIRSFRAEALSELVGHIVENRRSPAKDVYRSISLRYPICLTRNIDRARQWLRDHARGSERFGLVASSGATRLRPEGIFVKAKIDPPTWFLNDRSDVRSSFYLEEVATEFDVQGLELDWAAICWDADFRYASGQWTSHRFSGTNWQRVSAEERQLYLKNSYRVLLTRARQGMIIFVPEGNQQDRTRPSEFYDETFQFLSGIGFTHLD
jgi:hypothetical protein